MYDIPT
jgi:hypothetical protein